MVQQRFVRLAERAILDLHDDDGVAVNGVDLENGGQHPRGCVVDDRDAVGAGRKVIARKPQVAIGGHALGVVPAARSEGVDDHPVARHHRRPRARHLRHVEGRERGHRGEGREGRRGEAGGGAIGQQGRDDRYSSGMPAEGLLERLDVIGRVFSHS